MNETKTVAILQRVPAILVVTANSYGLPWQADGVRKPEAARESRRSERQDKASGRDKPAAH